MLEFKGLTRLWRWLTGRHQPVTRAESWLGERHRASPEAVIAEHFAAVLAHDLDWILVTLAPERARLYTSPRTLDKRRQTVADATILSINPAIDPAIDSPQLPAFVCRYQECLVLRVEFELKLAEPERRRDPSLAEGRQWSYFALVRERTDKPWLIADWGR